MSTKKPTTFERPLAITDIEATGLDWDTHEIIEIGLLVVDQDTLEVTDELDVKVAPRHIEAADPESLRIAGYKEKEWEDALSLELAMELYAKKVKDALFVAHPMTFDFSFIDRAFKETGVKNPMHYHQLDLFSMAWLLKREDEKLDNVTLHELTKHFDLEAEPTPHRAIYGARLTYEILKKLVGRVGE